MTNAIQVLESLSAPEIRDRLKKITAEQEALRVLLRAALSLEHRRQLDQSEPRRGEANQK